jgi:hypothetical protein
MSEPTKPKQVRIGDDLINLDLWMTPNDPSQAEGYPDLYALWLEIRDRLDKGEWRSKADREFVEWDGKVLALLRSDEVQRFNKPLRPHLADTPECASGAPDSRAFHLTKILWARQGIEKYMKDTGY